MRKIILFVALLLASTSYGQEAKKEESQIVTKMEKFTSRTGVILKFIDYKLPLLKGALGSGASETRVRKVMDGSSSAYFYQISKKGDYSTKTASIEYSDLIEVIKALKTLREEYPKDVALKPEYLENKFITDDGFQVGYYISADKSKWYVVLEKYGSGNTIFINDAQEIENSFSEAKSKIDSLK